MKQKLAEDRKLAERLEITFKEYTLKFKKPAWTSRSILTKRRIYILLLRIKGYDRIKEPLFCDKDNYFDDHRYLQKYFQYEQGCYIGEAAPLPGLSTETIDFDDKAFNDKMAWMVSSSGLLPEEMLAELVAFPSLRFAYEMAWQRLLQSRSFLEQRYAKKPEFTKKSEYKKSPKYSKSLEYTRDSEDIKSSEYTLGEAEQQAIFLPQRSDFLSGQATLPINGLVWVASYEEMIAQIDKLLAAGYTCLKIKVGNDLQLEQELLTYIRTKSKTVALRLDFNGSLATYDEAMHVLEKLAPYRIELVEQPLSPARTSQESREFKKLLRAAPIRIALDETLINITGWDAKASFIKEYVPQGLILKPTLLGGFSACAEWIRLANQYRIPWIVTSTLESSIGLESICEWAYPALNLANNTLHQGFGTGTLFSNNFPSNLRLFDGKLGYNSLRGKKHSKNTIKQRC
ncbi:hypothetical protein COTS27_00971 [Spirochaetota bacterium]|nr:hypothetical protein COTS27_00971 [Spirochaetota bacterium]